MMLNLFCSNLSCPREDFLKSSQILSNMNDEQCTTSIQRVNGNLEQKLKTIPWLKFYYLNFIKDLRSNFEIKKKFGSKADNIL